MEPDTSAMSTTRRGRSWSRRWMRRTGSPEVRWAARSVARMSSRAPRRGGARRRRAARSGGTNGSRSTRALMSASSSAVQSAKFLLAQRSSVLTAARTDSSSLSGSPLESPGSRSAPGGSRLLRRPRARGRRARCLTGRSTDGGGGVLSRRRGSRRSRRTRGTPGRRPGRRPRSGRGAQQRHAPERGELGQRSSARRAAPLREPGAALGRHGYPAGAAGARSRHDWEGQPAAGGSASAPVHGARVGSATQASPRARATSWSSRYFSTEPSVARPRPRRGVSSPISVRGVHPVDGLGDAGRLLHVEAAQPLHGAGHLSREFGADLGHSRANDGDRARERRVVDPVVQATSLQRVVQVARAVRRQDHDRWVGRGQRADLGDGDRRLGEQFEQERLELLVGAVDLVDQQHGRTRPGVLECGQQRPADEVVGPEQRLLGEVVAPRLGQPDPEQLSRVVPLVQRLGGVDPLEALQPDQRRVEQLGQRLGGLRLADPRLALEQQRLRQSYGAEQRGRPAPGQSGSRPRRAARPGRPGRGRARRGSRPRVLPGSARKRSTAARATEVDPLVVDVREHRVVRDRDRHAADRVDGRAPARRLTPRAATPERLGGTVHRGAVRAGRSAMIWARTDSAISCRRPRTDVESGRRVDARLLVVGRGRGSRRPRRHASGWRSARRTERRRARPR